ncbi:MAG: cell division protein FtsZ [Rickettsiales bacterium]|nr:cell division protein FtsZ [Rickettsiales bacterium]
MAINIQVPEQDKIHLKPTITVFGIGGAGGNVINNMIASKLEGIRFVTANTDAQALEQSLAERKIQLGHKLTQGLGAGSDASIGAAAAKESINEITRHITGSHMVIIVVGMGGGTGTGASTVVAKLSKEQGILTIGVITKPFHFEGKHRMKNAEDGIAELKKHVHTLITIPNQNLFKMADEKTTFSSAFKLADKVLHSGIRGITDLMIMPGLINLDFADIKTVMKEMGNAVIGSGEADGDNRATRAAEAAIYNPLLAYASMSGAKGILINITGGEDITLFEVDEAVNRIRQEIDNESTNIIFGSTFNEKLTGKIRVSIVATGIDSTPPRPNLILKHKQKEPEKIKPLPSATNESTPSKQMPASTSQESSNWLNKFLTKMAADLKITKKTSSKDHNNSSKPFLDDHVYKTPSFIRKKNKEHND